MGVFDNIKAVNQADGAVWNVEEKNDQAGGQDLGIPPSMPAAENIFAPTNDSQVVNDNQIQSFAADFSRSEANEVRQKIAVGFITREDADPVKWKQAIDTAKGLGFDEKSFDLVYDNLDEFSKQWKEHEVRKYVENCDAIKEMCVADAGFLSTLDEKTAKDMADINFNLAVYDQPDKPNAMAAFGQRIGYQMVRAEKSIQTGKLAGNVLGKHGEERQQAIAAWRAEYGKLLRLPEIDTSGFEAQDFILATADQLPIMARTTGAAAAGAGVGAGVGSVVPGVGTAAGAVTGYATLGKGLAAYQSYELETNSMMESLLDLKDSEGKELDPVLMDLTARAYGVTAAAIEIYGMDKVVSVIPGMKAITKAGLKNAIKEAVKDKTKRQVIMGIIKDYGIGVAAESAEEAAQQFAQAEFTRGAKALMNALYDTDFQQDKFINDLAESGEAAIAAGKASVLFSGMGSALRVRPELRAQVKQADMLKSSQEVKAKFDAQRMDDVAKAAQVYMQKPSAEKASLKAYMQKAKRGSIYQDIYMSGDDAKAVMLSEAVQKNKAVLKESGLFDSIEQQIAQAEELGTPVRIGLETFGSEIMANQELYGAFKDVIKTYENGITMAELKIKAEKRENYRKELDKAAQDNAADFEYAYRWTVEQLALGGIDQQQRAAIAEGQAKFATYAAKNTNTPIQDFMANYAPQFERSFDGSISGGANVQNIIQTIRKSAADNEVQNLMKRAGELGKRDARQIAKILSKHIDNAAVGDIRQFMRVANAIGDMKLDIEAMSDEDIIKSLGDYTASTDLKLNIKRDAADKIKSGIFSASEMALKDIQAEGGASDYVLVGGGRIPVNYEIVELGDVITSHDDAGAVNAAYPQDLQPRDRSRTASDSQIAGIVNHFAPERVAKAEIATEGAPIVTEQGYVAVGNGRAMAIRQMYNNEATAQKYKDYLSNKGFDLTGFERPVLVRRLALSMDNEQLKALVDDANTAGTMQYSDSENALRDAEKMSGNLFDLLDLDADIDSAANQRFLNGFFAEVVPTAERNAYLDKDDKITRKGVERVENAIVAKLLPDIRFLSVLVENPDNNIRKITKELAKAAPAIMAFENDIASGRIGADYSIAADVSGAVELLKRAKDRSVSTADFLAMRDMFEEPIASSTQNMVQLFENASGAADFLNKIRSYIRQATEHGDMEQVSIFEIAPVTKQELLERIAGQDALFQSEADKLFKPSRIEKSNYIADLRSAEQAAGNVGQTIRLGELPFIYREIGIPAAKVITNKKTIIKDTIQKHAVSMDVVENLPDLYADPVMVFAALDKSTNKNAYVAVLDAFDKDGKQMIAAISPAKNDGGYHMITSFYGRNNIENMIKTAFSEKKVKYVRSKKNSLLTGHNAHLSQTGNSIIEKSDIVNKSFYQLPTEAYNKQGKADVNSEVFKRWFGDSKVVDENGQPLVVYHGSNVEFDTFDKGNNGYFFTSDFQSAEIYAREKQFEQGGVRNIMPVYLLINNPIQINNYQELRNINTEKLIQQGYDGVEYKSDTQPIWVAFEPNQIKSVNNRGTFDPNNDNIYYQSAFAGSRVDYDKPSIEAIGSGEGSQAHGWGLYYALNRDIAERYRKEFTQETKTVLYDGKPYFNNDEYLLKQLLLEVKEVGKEQYVKELEELKNSDDYYMMAMPEIVENDIKFLQTLDEKTIEINKISTREEKGQVHEVDIPENPFLLDEQKIFAEQSNFVKGAIRELNNKDINDIIDNDVTGEDIYGELVNSINSQTDYTLSQKEAEKRASQALEKVGIKGIAYDGRQDGRCFVIFNPDDVKVIQKFYQETENEAYGAYVPIERKIILFRNNNLSTLIHETGHWWLDTLSKLAVSDKANDKLRQDWQTVKEWLEIGDDNQITTEQHEKFARGVEKYFMTRKAPSSKLKGLFDTFARWLASVYKDVKELDVDLNDDVVRVFDHWLASEAEIEEYKQAAEFANMLEKSNQKGLSKEELDKYTALAAQSLTMAKDKHLMDKVALILKEETEEYKEKQAQLKAHVLEEWAAERINKAVYVLVTGEIPHGKLDLQIKTEDLQRILGNDFAKYATFGGRQIFADDGLSLDQIKDFTGLSEYEVKAALLTARARMNNFKKELQRRTHEELGDPVTYEDIEKQVVSAFWNEKRADLLDMDIRALSNNSSRPAVAVQGFKLWAQSKISNMAIKDLKPELYAKQMQIAGDKALQALNHGNKNLAYREKIKQIRNFVLYQEATAKRTEVESTLRRLKQIGKQETNTSVDQVYQDAARALLARFTLSRTLTKKAKERLGHLSTWILEQRSNGYDISLPADLLEKNNGTSYAELTVDEFLTLGDSVKSLIANGRAIKEYEIEGQLVERDKMLSDLAVQLNKTYKLRKIQKTGKKEFKGISEVLAPADAAILTIGDLSNRIDGYDTSGIFHKMFLKPMTESQNRENELLRLYGGKMKSLQEALPETIKQQLFDNVEGARKMLGADYTRAELIAIGLNMGNYSNLQRLTDGNGFNEKKLGWISRTLSKEEWDYIQGIWDTLETMYPLLAEHHKKMSGLDMDHVVAAPVNTPYGIYRGGYFPLFYDRSADIEARQNNSLEQALLESDYGRATTSKGYTKNRQEIVKEKVKFDLALIHNHLATAIHDLAYRGNIRQMWNLANHPDFINAMDTHMHESYRRQLLKLIKDLANTTNRAAREMTFAEKLARNMRVSRTTIGLGFRVRTAAKQLTGFAQSTAVMKRYGHKNKGKHNGAYWLAKGVQTFAADKSVREWCVACSGELQARLNNMDANIAEAMKSVAKKQTKAQKLNDTIYQAAFWAIGKVDVFTAESTWYGAYLQARHDFNYEHKQAVFYADRVMIESQGSGNLKDKPAMQRANEWEKMLLMFYSPFSGMYGLWTSVARDIRDGNARAAALADLAVAMCLPAWLDAIVDGDQPGSDDDLAKWLELLLLRPIAFWASTMPIARDLASYFEFCRAQGFFTDSFKALANIPKVFTRDKYTAGKRVNVLMNASAQLVGTAGANLPVGGQVADWVQWLVDVAAGNVKIDSPMDVFWGVWRGKDGEPKK